MADFLFRNESPAEYFRELVDQAMQHQQLEACELTYFYLVNLLSGFVRCDPADEGDEALAMRLMKALESDRVKRRDGLRRVGDQSLFISGFFADSLNRSVVDVDYYISLGEYAYGSLADDEALGDVFDELAENFTAFVDVLSEVSERSALASNQNLLRLYEKWVRTRSPRSADLLLARGILPPAPAGNRLH